MPNEPATSQMTTEEKKFLMKAVWESFTTPKWSKDDLIDFGKAIYTGVPLSKMPEDTFRKIFPFLTEIVVALGSKLGAEAEKQAAAIAEAEKRAAAPKPTEKSEEPAPEAAEERT